MAEGNYRDIDKGSASISVDCSSVPRLNGGEDHVLLPRNFAPFIVGIPHTIHRLCDDAQGSNVYLLVMDEWHPGPLRAEIHI